MSLSIPLNFYKLNTIAAVALALLSFAPSPAHAALNIPITVNLSESINVTGTPQIAVDVGGTPRYATYTSGTGTNALTFTLSPQAGDVDLDGVTVSSPIQLNGGTIKDTKGNNATLTFTPPNTANVKVNYPSLGMDFVYDADGRYTLNGTPYNDLSSFLTATGGSFTRASVGTYFDSTGTLQTASANTPRFDYDPVTHTPKGILIEESRTNYASYSNKITTKVGTGYGYSGDTTELFTTDAGVAPDGSNTASFAVTGSRFFKEVGISNGQFTLSIWLKVPSGSSTATLNIKNFQTDNIKATSTVTLTSSWQRFALTGLTNGSNIGVRAEVNYPSGGVYAWGMQIEAASFATSYIPTTTAAVTRAADVLTIPTGSWFDSSKGSAIAEIADYNRIVGSIFALNDGTGSNRYDMRAEQKFSVFTANGGANTTLSPLNFTSSGGGKAGISYSPSVAKASFQGGSVINGTAVSPTGINKLWIGSIDSGLYQLCGHIKRFKYYPVVESDTQLQLLTQ